MKKTYKKSSLSCLVMLYLCSVIGVTNASTDLASHPADSSNVKPASVEIGGFGYILDAKDRINVGTYYYGEPDQLIGSTNMVCVAGYHPQAVFSIGSESIYKNCYEEFASNESYCRTVQNPSGYQIWGRVWLRRENACNDGGFYVSYVLYCMPGSGGGNCSS